MKLWHILSSITLSVTLVGCAGNNPDRATPASSTPAAGESAPRAAIAQPSVSGTVNIRQRMALPNNAVLTVTVSDASLSDAPTRVIARQVSWTDGKQAPFSFVLPFNPSDIQPTARILLSAAISIDNRLIFITDSVIPVINNGVLSADLLLVPASEISLPVRSSVAPVSPESSPAI